MKAIIYGLGNNYIKNYTWIKNNYNVIALIDGDIKKQGTEIDGLIIKSFKDIPSIDYDVVIITPNDCFEITQNLVNVGVERNKILHLPELLKVSNKDKLKILIEVTGGLGDKLIGINYIYYFKKTFTTVNTSLVLAVDAKRSIPEDIVKGISFIDEYLQIDKKNLFEDYCDLYIEIIRYPKVLFANKKKIALINPSLIDYILLCEKYEIFNERYFERNIIPDGGSALYEELFQRNRLQQPDIYGTLGITKEYGFEICIERNILTKLNLLGKNFITVHRGCDEKYYSQNATKLWLWDYYSELLNLIKRHYPKIIIVSIGAKYEKEDLSLPVDIDLIGKTSVKEWLALLKYSKLHIDSEGGNVHLRKVLNGGKSIVIFGPTSDKFFGYQSNINIRSNACPYPCEWATLDWSKKCLLGDGVPRCMKSILPEDVFAKVKQELGE